MPFQSYVQLTMLDNHIHQSDKSVKLMERSIFSARYCFVENMFTSGKILGCEYEVLDQWFKFLTNPGGDLNLNVDLIIYLKTTPEKALERINERARSEENKIPLEYLVQLHQHHEDWLLSGKYDLPAPVLVIDADKVRFTGVCSIIFISISQDLHEMQDVYRKHECDVFGQKKESERLLPTSNEKIKAAVLNQLASESSNLASASS